VLGGLKTVQRSIFQVFIKLPAKENGGWDVVPKPPRFRNLMVVYGSSP